MTEFKTVHDSRVEEPAIIDTTSSESTVYERRNIRQETRTMEMGGGDPVTITEWVYEQREYTKEEYAMMLSPAIQGVQQSLSDIELAIAMM